MAEKARPLDCKSKHKFNHGSSEAKVTCQHPAPHDNMRHGTTVLYDDGSAVTWSWPVNDADRVAWADEMTKLDSKINAI